MGVAERHRWTAEVLGPGPEERVLEVGPGHGVLLGLLAERVPRGAVVGVDRSATMTAAAARRNRSAVDAGRVRVLTAPLAGADLGDQRFDAVVAVDVRAFWTPPAPEWDVVARVLSQGGRVLVAYRLEGVQARLPVEDTVSRLAGERGLRLVRVHRGATAPTPSVALELRRA